MNQTRWLIVAMLVSVAGFAVAMLLHERSEFDAAVAASSSEQSAIATALADDVESRIARFEEVQGHATVPPVASLLGGALALQQPGSRVLLVLQPGARAFTKADGGKVASEALRGAFERGAQSVVLPGEAAIPLGLPRRIAIVGIGRAASARGNWGVAVVASGERLRSRESVAQARFLIGLVVVTALVAGFGGMALKQQRRKLEVARALEVSALEREQERLLAQADKMATLAALSSGIAHEVATPLSTILVRIEQVMPVLAGDPKSTAALSIALQQVQRIQTIIQGVLNLARGRPPAMLEARPRDIVDGALDFVRHRLEKAGVHIVSRTATELPCLSCDKPMIEQALANLLLNACDASIRGGSVRVSVQSREGRVAFIVEDEGPGISEETARLALKPFVTTKPNGRGTGLGLAIAQEIVANHGGKILLERGAGGRGTRAVIELPRT
jgi:two-component system NtrC family sensor kinase